MLHMKYLMAIVMVNKVVQKQKRQESVIVYPFHSISLHGFKRPLLQPI